MKNPTVLYMFERFTKNKQMLSYVRRNPAVFEELLQLSFDLHHKQAWRCAMLVGHIIKRNDLRIVSHIDKYIDVLPILPHDGHQRQVLIILDKMKLKEDQEGRLFDKCMTLWEDINKIPSTRIRAFWLLLKIAKPYPEIQQEIKHFTSAYYLETLSPGIKYSLEQKIQKFT